MPARFAVPGDLGAINRLIEPHIDLLNREYGGYNREKADRRILEAIEAGLAVVIEEDGEITGTIGLEPIKMWHGDETMLTNLWIHTVPGHRSFAAWRLLVAVAREMAEEAGVKLRLGFEAHEDADRKHRLFGRAGRLTLDTWGFTPVGGTYRISESA